MISKKKFDSVDGITSRFLADLIIQSEQFARVYNYVYNPAGVEGDVDGATGLFIRVNDAPNSSDLVTLDKWDLVDNSILFYTNPPATSSVWIEVATTPEEFGETLVAPSVERAETARDAAEASAVAALASEVAAGLSETAAASSASAANIDKLAVDARLDTVQTNTLTVEQNLDAVTSDPVKTQLANAAINAATATTKAAEAVISASEAQLEAWISEAEALTSESNASEPVGVFTKTYTSDGDGTFTATPNAWYSSYHYAQQAISGGTERTSARNTILSTAAAGALAQAVTPTPSFATITYTADGTTTPLITGLESSDPNWVSAGSYTIGDIIVHDYYIYTALTTHTGVATTPDLDATNWQVVADGVPVAYNNSRIEIKNTGAIASHFYASTLMGRGWYLSSDTTAAQVATTSIASYDATGVTVTGTSALNNANTNTYVLYQETFDTMVSGTTNQGKRYITASSAQSGKGMAIYVGSGVAGHEIPHGLGTKIDFNVVKSRVSVTTWATYDTPSGATVYKALDSNIANTASSALWNDTEPTSTVFTVGTSVATNILGEDLVAYFSSNRDNHTVTKMYQGTGLAGNVVDLGLDMTQVGAKCIFKYLNSAGSWVIIDNIRGGTKSVYADVSNSELTGTYDVTYTTTGITLNNTHAAYNASGGQYLIEATVPNYDKPNGGLNRPAGNILSYAEGVDGTTGDLDSIETTTSVDFTLTAGAKNYLFSDKGNTVASSIYPMIKQIGKTLDANSHIYDVETGTVLSPAGVESSRIPLGEVVVDALGEAILDTLVVYPKTNDFVDVEVHGDAKFYGDVSGKNICTAWVNFDGTTTPPTIRDSYNVIDVVRTATGTYELFPEVRFIIAYYAVQGTASSSVTGSARVVNIVRDSIGLDSFKVEVQATSDGTTNVDETDITIYVYGGM